MPIGGRGKGWPMRCCSRRNRRTIVANNGLCGGLVEEPLPPKPPKHLANNKPMWRPKRVLAAETAERLWPIMAYVEACRRNVSAVSAAFRRLKLCHK
jgi:hypothetical protein